VARAARQMANRITPAVLRRSLALLIGAALLGGVAPAGAVPPAGAAVAATATATPGLDPARTLGPAPGPAPGLDPDLAPTSRTAAVQAAVPAALDPGWAHTPEVVRPQLPDLDPGWGPRSRLRAGVRPETSVVVRRGDTIWDITARHLGPAATDAEIAQAWPAWFAANRDVIGPDPDRLQPGQRLSPPASPSGGSA
jgi:nucleoid-associated protein YgaU